MDINHAEPQLTFPPFLCRKIMRNVHHGFPKSQSGLLRHLKKKLPSCLIGDSKSSESCKHQFGIKGSGCKWSIFKVHACNSNKAASSGVLAGWGTSAKVKLLGVSEEEETRWSRTSLTFDWKRKLRQQWEPSWSELWFKLGQELKVNTHFDPAAQPPHSDFAISTARLLTVCSAASCTLFMSGQGGSGGGLHISLIFHGSDIRGVMNRFRSSCHCRYVSKQQLKWLL